MAILKAIPCVQRLSSRKSLPVKDMKRNLLFHMHRHQPEVTQITKNQASIAPSKETNNNPVIDPRELEIHELLEKEFKIIVLR